MFQGNNQHGPDLAQSDSVPRLTLRRAGLFTLIMVITNLGVLHLMDLLTPRFPALESSVLVATAQILITLPLMYFLLSQSFRTSFDNLSRLEAKLRKAKFDLELQVNQQTDELARVNENLSLMIDEMEESATQQELVTDMSELLQSCNSSSEAFEIFSDYAERLLCNISGTLWIMSPSKNYLEATCYWGEKESGKHVFNTGDCWALRRGNIYKSLSSSRGAKCHHHDLSPGETGYCFPLNAQGEIIAVLSLVGDSSSFDKQVQPLAKQIAETLAIAISNLRLREKLLDLSIRDSLTSLYNRRYMNEFLERELRRSVRKKNKVAVAMIDVDHFKNFNDKHGHRAGDLALVEVARTLRSNIRDTDIACRFGGEEFTLIMPDTEPGDLRTRCDQIRQAVEKLTIHDNGQLLDATTISIGIAISPVDGETNDELIRAADDALYAAKKQGRNRIVLSSELTQLTFPKDIVS